MIALLIAVLVIGSFLFVAWPVLNASGASLGTGPHGNGQLQGFLDQRDNLLTTIKDLEFDYRMGKLSDADFAELDTQYRNQAIEVLERIDLTRPAATDKRKKNAGNGKSSRHKKNVRAIFCPICGESVRDGDEFCSDCGSALR